MEAGHFVPGIVGGNIVTKILPHGWQVFWGREQVDQPILQALHGRRHVHTPLHPHSPTPKRRHAHTPLLCHVISPTVSRQPAARSYRGTNPNSF